MGHVTYETILTAWWRPTKIRALVLILTALAALDSVYTLVWIGQRGLAGELNPLIRTFSEMGLVGIWIIINVVATFVASVFLGSCVTALPTPARLYPVLGLSLLAALKVILALYHLIQFYNLLEITWIVWLTCVITFLSTKSLLSKEGALDWKSLAYSVRELRSDLSTAMIMSCLTKPTLPNTVETTRIVQPTPQPITTALRNWKLIFWVIVIILAPILALSLIDIILGASGVLALPSWMRSLGIVSEEQGRLFLLALVTIFLTIAVSVYGIVAVFEIISAEPRRRPRKKQQ